MIYRPSFDMIEIHSDWFADSVDATFLFSASTTVSSYPASPVAALAV